MLHLLPEYQKRKVIGEYRIRLGVVFVWSLTVLSCLSAILTLPAYISIIGEKNSLMAEKNIHQSVIDAGNKQGGATKLDITKAVEALAPYPNPLVPTLFVQALSKGANGISIDGYSLVQNNSTDPVVVVLSGNARTRESLSNYARSLNEVFGNVKLPLSSLAKQGDIPFEFKFQADFKTVMEYIKK